MRAINRIDVNKVKERSGSIGNNLIVAGIIASFFSKEVPLTVSLGVMIIGTALFFVSVLKHNKEDV